MSRLPKPPADYRPAGPRELRQLDLAHNRRLGWRLALAERHGLADLDPGTLEERAAQAHRLLPDVFDSADQAAGYVESTEDLELAREIVARSVATGE